MSEPKPLHSFRPQRGDTIRSTRPMRLQTHEGVVIVPTGTRGVVTSVGEVAVFAKIRGYESEILPGEYEVVR